ncbi:hypothetical protein HYW21_08825 [Candidatus Woesearchaeota archaeon]|nr:hypothetical protein [Candidatus Woesearchaeota archaeon]
MVILFGKGGVAQKDFDATVRDFQRVINSFREEFDDHLDAINENTNEIQTNYEYLCALDAKIEKVAEKVDSLMLLLGQTKAKSGHQQYVVQPLTHREQELFLVLYTHEQGFLSYAEVARKLGFTVQMVEQYIANVIQKGVPLIKRFQNNLVYVSLDPEFRNLQTKENIVQLDEDVVKSM